MNKTDINEWLSIVANFAVVAGIAFVGIELHQNNQLLKQQAEFVAFENRRMWSGSGFTIGTRITFLASTGCTVRFCWATSILPVSRLE